MNRESNQIRELLKETLHLHTDKIDCVKLPDAKNEAGLSLGHLLFKASFVIGGESLGDTGG